MARTSSSRAQRGDPSRSHTRSRPPPGTMDCRAALAMTASSAAPAAPANRCNSSTTSLGCPGNREAVRMKAALVAATLLLAAAPAIAADLKAEIQHDNERFSQAFNKGDAAAVAK